MDEPLFSFPGIDGLVAYLDGQGPNGARTFPEVKAKLADLRVAESEKTIHTWYARCANAFEASGDPPPRWQLAEDLMVFAQVEWGDPGRRLLGCCVSVLKTQGSLNDFYSDQSIPAFYLRMDYDYSTLGPMFTHPLPHIHAWLSDAAPRFVAEGQSDNILIDFMEWICRHFYHKLWEDWAIQVCSPYFSKRYTEEQNPLISIFLAFNESNIPFLRERQDDIRQIKKLLKEEKDGKFGLRVSEADRDLISYP